MKVYLQMIQAKKTPMKSHLCSGNEDFLELNIDLYCN